MPFPYGFAFAFDLPSGNGEDDLKCEGGLPMRIMEIADRNIQPGPAIPVILIQDQEANHIKQPAIPVKIFDAKERKMRGGTPIPAILVVDGEVLAGAGTPVIIVGEGG